MGRKRRPSGWIQCPKKRRSAIGKREPTIFKKGMELYENCGVTVTLVTEKNGEYHFYHTGDGSIAHVLARYLAVAEDAPEAFSRRDAKLKAAVSEPESEGLGGGVDADKEEQEAALDDLGEWDVVDGCNWKQQQMPSSSKHCLKTPTQVPPTSVIAASAAEQTNTPETNGTHPPLKKAPRKRNRSNVPPRSRKSRKKTAKPAVDVAGEGGDTGHEVKNENTPREHIEIPLQPGAQGCARESAMESSLTRKRGRPEEEIHHEGVLFTNVGKKKKNPSVEHNIQVDDWLTAVEGMMQSSKTGEASVATTADDPIFAKFVK